MRSLMTTAATIAATLLAVAAPARSQQTITVSNPFLWADIPDISILRVDSTYYMSQTTMHMAPGVPIMESKDLAHWKTISYCYGTLANNDNMNLAGGKNAYGKGSWASSLRYKNGTWYCLVPSYTTGKTHLYSTKDIRSSNWKEVLLPFYHDPSLILDDDGRNYVAYGSGDVKIVELTADLSGVKSGGMNKTLIANADAIAAPVGLRAEGTQVFKVNGYYYVFNITWANSTGRTELCHRSKSLDGTFEGKIVQATKGVAQGGIVQMTNGSWMGYLFQDNGAVGRSPWLIPVTWQNDWPVFNGGAAAPTSITVPAVAGADKGTGIVTSDDFDGTTLHPEWQINHNPDAANWSLTARPGSYRITTGRVDASIFSARNSLTQRSFGPKCSGRIALDASGMKDGDVAGLSAFADSLGYVAVKKSGGSLSVIQMQGTVQKASVAISQKRVFLRVDMDFTNRTDKATFFYSLDSTTWKPIGSTLQMSYTLGMFMGYRFALFDFATATAGGYADFDWFKIGATVNEAIDMYPASQTTGLLPAMSEAKGLRCISSRDGLEVTWEGAVSGPLELRIVDATGRTALRTMTESVKGEGLRSSIPTAGIPEGRYLLAVVSGGRTLGARHVTILR